MASPMSKLPAAIPVLISAPLPASLQVIFAFTPSSNQPSPFAIIVGLVSRKKATFTVDGTAARAGRAKTSATTMLPVLSAVYRRNVRRLSAIAGPLSHGSPRTAGAGSQTRLAFGCGSHCGPATSYGSHCQDFRLASRRASPSLRGRRSARTATLVSTRPVHHPQLDRQEQPIKEQP